MVARLLPARCGGSVSSAVVMFLAPDKVNEYIMVERVTGIFREN